MFVVSEAEAAAIRAAFDHGGELAAAVELRRLLPDITDNAEARAGARTIAAWKPLPIPRREWQTACGGCRGTDQASAPPARLDTSDTSAGRPGWRFTRISPARKEAGPAAWRIIDIQLPDRDQAVTPETFGFKLNWQKLREAPRLDQQLVAGHLDRGSWCDTYQQLYRLIRDLSVSSTNSRSFRFHFSSSGHMTRVMQQLIVVWIDGALRTSA